MAEREEDWAGNVSYKDSSGGSHYSESDANQADANRYAEMNTSGGSSGGGFIGGLAGPAAGASNAAIGIIVLIILAIPAIVAKIAGTIFAFLFKLGVFGKILQTILFSAVCTVILLFATGMFSGDVFATFAIPVFILGTLWYWLYHYDEIKTIPIKEFSNGVTISFAIVIYGFVLDFVLVAWIAKILFGEKAAGIIMFIVMLALFVVAILVYLARIKTYWEEAAKVRTHAKRKKIILAVAAIYFAVAIGSGFVASLLGLERKEINIDLTGRSTAGKSFETGSTITVPEIVLLKEPSYTSEFLKTIPKGDEVLVIGKTVKRQGDEFVQVEHQGVKGYLDTEELQK